MSAYFILYNPIAANKHGKEKAQELKKVLRDESFIFEDITSVINYYNFFAKLEPDDKIVIAVGDGTLNRFINSTDGMDIKNDIYYYAAGSGNDFFRDVSETDKKSNYCKINKYIKNLPTVEVNGQKYKFLNGIGFGIDGYCCEVGDEMRKNISDSKEINYTSIAIKGLLFKYKPTDAEITADGVTCNFKNVWLAPTMNGRFYGGGMMPTPNQNRLNNETVSTMVMHSSGKLKTLMIFPSIFKGEHIKHPDTVSIISGKEITVKFSEPRALQIDGETIKNVTEYTVSAPPVKKEEKENKKVDIKSAI